MKFCFWGEITDALNGITIGGGELQSALLARALAKEGHEVVVIDPFTNESFITKEGIKIIHIPEENKGLPVVGTFFRRIFTFYKLLVKQKADFYYIRTRSYFHLLPYLAARKTGGKLILGIASDLDVFSIWKIFKYNDRFNFNLIRYLKLELPNNLVFRFILKKTNYITLQHEGQRLSSGLLKGRQVIFENIFDQNLIPDFQKQNSDYFISVGSLTMLKGAANLLELVKMLDRKIKIVIVGEPRCRKTRKIYTELSKIDNVELKGRVRHNEALKLIGNAKALINASNFEGFPNIFVESWAQGVPVISLKVNPGSVISKHGLGLYCNGDVRKMKEYIETNATGGIEKGKLISYVKHHHNFQRAGRKFINILRIRSVQQIPRYQYADSFFHRFFSGWWKRA